MDKVFVSVFARHADSERSTVKFDSPEQVQPLISVIRRTKKVSYARQVTLDIHLPGSKRFSRVLNLFGPIDPAKSTFLYFNTKVSASSDYRPLAKVYIP